MIAIRRAGARDAPVVACLVDALLAELGSGPSQLGERTATAGRLLALDDRVFGFLAHDEAAPVGAMMLAESLSIYAGGAFGVITELYVTPGHRSSGVAPRLVAAGAALGRARGWRQLEVGAPHQPAWARSLHFYLRNGFTEIGPRLRLRL